MVLCVGWGGPSVGGRPVVVVEHCRRPPKVRARPACVGRPRQANPPSLSAPPRPRAVPRRHSPRATAHDRQSGNASAVRPPTREVGGATAAARPPVSARLPSFAVPVRGRHRVQGGRHPLCLRHGVGRPRARPPPELRPPLGRNGRAGDAVLPCGGGKVDMAAASAIAAARRRRPFTPALEYTSHSGRAQLLGARLVAAALHEGEEDRRWRD